MADSSNNPQPDQSGTEQWNKTNTSDQGNPATEKKNPVDQALTKEKQPTSQEDLSPIHNTHAVGTSGGDQRAPDDTPPAPNEEESEQPGRPVRPIPVEEPGEGNAPEIEYEEPGKEPPVSTEE